MNDIQDPLQALRGIQAGQNITNAVPRTQIWAGNHVVGVVIGGEFVKKVRGSKHFLRKPPAISFDITSLEEARASGASSVRVIDEETGNIYQASILTIFAKGFPFNRGHGEQIGLGFMYWQQGDNPLATQLGLWG